MKIFDIGTNHGHFIEEYISLYPDLQAICIDANLSLCNYLFSKYENNLNIKVYHYLVSQKSKEYIDFYISKGCDGVSTASTSWVKDSRFNREQWADPIKIESITLDDLIDNTFMPDMIKIDVEGYENTVIKGLTKKVNLIQFEWAEEEMESVKDTCDYLESIGYTQFAYRFEDRPYSYIPTEYYSLNDLKLFEQLIPSRKEKWGMIYAK